MKNRLEKRYREIIRLVWFAAGLLCLSGCPSHVEDDDNPMPASPSGLSVVSSATDSIELSWIDNADNETGFVIEYKTNFSDFKTAATLDADTTEYTHEDLLPGTRYTYRIMAFNNAGSSGFSPEINVMTEEIPHEPPSAPDDLVAAVLSAHEIRLEWTDTADNEAGFVIEARSSEEDIFTEIKTVSRDTRQTVIGSLSHSTTYFFRIKARNAAGDSAYTGPASATTLTPQPVPPSPPESFTAILSASSSIVLSWSDSSDIEEGFRIFRRSGGNADFEVITVLGPDTTAYRDEGLESFTVYTYRICAFNDTGDSAFVETSSIVTGLKIPSDINTLGGSVSAVVIRWDSIPEADGYSVYRSESTAGSYTDISGTIGETVYSDAKAVPGKLYYYKIMAHAAAGDSDLSPAVSGYRVLDAPARCSVEADDDNDRITVTFDGVDGADRYEIERSTNGSSFSDVTMTTGTRYNDESAENGQAYYYRVRAYADSSRSYGDFIRSERVFLLLASPDDIRASDGTSEDYVEISWKSIDNADRYEVERSTSTGGSYSEIGRSTSTSYRDTQAQPGKQYYYRARGYNTGTGNGKYSGYDPGHRKLECPSSVEAADGTSLFNIGVEWDDVYGADQYILYRSASRNGSYAKIADRLTAERYTDTSCSPGILYYYKVKAYASSSGSESDFSPDDTGYRKLEEPGHITASRGDTTYSIRVTWNRVDGADSYIIYRKSESSSFREYDDSGTTSFIDDDCTPGLLYTYKVMAYSESSDSTSDLSYDQDEGYADLSRPSMASVTIYEIFHEVRLSWYDVDGATDYDVYCNGRKLGRTILSIYTHTSAPEGTNCYYIIAYASSARIYSDESSSRCVNVEYDE
ncbi:MAG: fibronectin type III domain-containing protein [Spirochaetales bacterium]|nr:fibronectin type III domain-containing protein [Spirochaetales bacterium]